MASVKSLDPIRNATRNFIKLLQDLGYTPDEIIAGMDESLDQFDITTAIPQP
jgi:hypothetical protein